MKKAEPKKHKSQPQKARKPRRPGRPRVVPTRLPVYASMADCSGSTGIPVGVLKHARKNGCPAFHASNRVDLSALLPWLFARSDSESSQDWKSTFDEWRAKNERAKFEKSDRLVIARDQVERAVHLAEDLWFAEVSRLFLADLPPRLVNISAPEDIRARAAEAVEALRASLRAGLAKALA